MRKPAHKKAFDALSPSEYIIGSEQSVLLISGFSDLLADALGYDVKSDGFLAIHRRHAMAALKSELPACLILKRTGHAVVLLEESSFHKSADALVNGILFEFKSIARAKNLKNAFVHQFRTAKGKSRNLLVHVQIKVKAEGLRFALFYALQKYPHFDAIWLAWQGRIYQFSKEQVLAGRHQFY